MNCKVLLLMCICSRLQVRVWVTLTYRFSFRATAQPEPTIMISAYVGTTFFVGGYSLWIYLPLSSQKRGLSWGTPWHKLPISGQCYDANAEGCALAA